MAFMVKKSLMARSDRVMAITEKVKRSQSLLLFVLLPAEPAFASC